MKNSYDFFSAESVKRSAVFFQKTGARGGNKRSRCLTAFLCVLLTVCICFTGCAGRPAEPTQMQNTESGETDGTVSDPAQTTDPTQPVSSEPEASLPEDTEATSTEAAATTSSEPVTSMTDETEPTQTTAAPEPTKTEPVSEEPTSQATRPSETAASETAVQPTQRANDTKLITDGVYISDIFGYSGLYMEDGSNTACTNVCAVLLRNDSDQHYQYVKFELETAGGTYTFAATTLFSGAQMTVLCENGAAFTGAEVLSMRVIAVAPFTETPTVHTDTLEISYTDGFINVKNISGKTLTNVYIYYKNTDANGYLGGITYRASFGDLAPGELKQSGASNMHRATGKVVFATYDH